MTFEVILYFMKNLCFYNVSIHRKFDQNRFINEYAKKKKAKISESRNHGMTESRSFLVRYRRTYVLKTYVLNKVQDSLENILQSFLKILTVFFDT